MGDQREKLIIVPLNKGKVQVYSLTTYQPFFFPWSLDLFMRVPFQLHREHTGLQPFRYTFTPVQVKDVRVN